MLNSLKFTCWDTKTNLHAHSNPERSRKPSRRADFSDISSPSTNASLIRICSASPSLCSHFHSFVWCLTPLKTRLTCRVTADFMVYFLWWKGRQVNLKCDFNRCCRICFGPGRIGAHRPVISDHFSFPHLLTWVLVTHSAMSSKVFVFFKISMASPWIWFYFSSRSCQKQTRAWNCFKFPAKLRLSAVQNVWGWFFHIFISVNILAFFKAAVSSRLIL